MSNPCSVDGCGNEAKKGGLCWAHLKRRKRDRSMSAPLQERGSTPWQAVVIAALKFAEDTERPSKGKPTEEYKRAEHAFYMAVYRFKLNERGQLEFRRRDDAPMSS